MKALFVLLIFSFAAFGETREVSSGKMEYKVSHVVKTVTGKSEEVRGKMECDSSECEFLLGSKVSSFVSSDSNRDVNMMTLTESAKFPLVTGAGKVHLKNLQSPSTFQHEVLVEFHGVKKTYQVKTTVTGEKKLISKLVLKLEDHGVERPSLFGVKIKNEVPLVLETEWVGK